jgi:hypothetical protein
MKEPQAYFEEKAAEDLQQEAAAAVGKKGPVKFVPKRIPKRVYQFKVYLG